MPKPPTVTTVADVRKIIDWVIKYLLIVKGRLCRKKPALTQAFAAAGGGKIPWDVDCPPPADPPEVDVCDALDACIAALKKLKESFASLPARHPLA